MNIGEGGGAKWTPKVLGIHFAPKSFEAIKISAPPHSSLTYECNDKNYKILYNFQKKI